MNAETSSKGLSRSCQLTDIVVSAEDKLLAESIKFLLLETLSTHSFHFLLGAEMLKKVEETLLYPSINRKIIPPKAEYSLDAVYCEVGEESFLIINLVFNGSFGDLVASWRTEAHRASRRWPYHHNKMFRNPGSILKKVRPIEETILKPFECPPASCQVILEGEVKPGRLVQGAIREIRDLRGANSREFNRLIVQAVRGKILNGTALEIDPELKAFIIGTGTIKIQYQAPSAAEEGEDTIFVYNSPDILDPEVRPLPSSGLKDRICQYKVHIAPPTGESNIQRVPEETVRFSEPQLEPQYRDTGRAHLPSSRVQRHHHSSIAIHRTSRNAITPPGSMAAELLPPPPHQEEEILEVRKLTENALVRQPPPDRGASVSGGSDLPPSSDTAINKLEWQRLQTILRRHEEKRKPGPLQAEPAAASPTDVGSPQENLKGSTPAMVAEIGSSYRQQTGEVSKPTFPLQDTDSVSPNLKAEAPLPAGGQSPPVTEMDSRPGSQAGFQPPAGEGAKRGSSLTVHEGTEAGAIQLGEEAAATAPSFPPLPLEQDAAWKVQRLVATEASRKIQPPSRKGNEVTEGEDSAGIFHPPEIPAVHRAALEVLPPSRSLPEGLQVRGIEQKLPEGSREGQEEEGWEETEENHQVPTQIGPLPSDLWSLIGKPKPAVPSPGSPPGEDSRLSFPAAPLRLPENVSPVAPVVQRQPQNEGSSPRPAIKTEHPGATPETEVLPEVDIEELSNQVYLQLRRRLMVEWEQGRGGHQ